MPGDVTTHAPDRTATPSSATPSSAPAAPEPPPSGPSHTEWSGDWSEGWSQLAFEDRMATVEFRVGDRAHITIDGDACRGCTTKACVSACPANLFAPLTDGSILFNYEQCFECGTCYLVCNTAGAITWTYPDGGHGVVFHHS